MTLASTKYYFLLIVTNCYFWKKLFLSIFTVFSLSTKKSLPLFYVQDMWEQQFQFNSKYLVVRKNVQNYPQQWYQWPQILAHRVAIRIEFLTDWVRYRWKKIFTGNWLITKEFFPPSIWQTNCKYTGISELTSYLQLIHFTKIQKIRLKSKHLVVHPNVQIDTQQWYQWTRHLVRHFSVLIKRLTDWVHNRWQKRFT